MVPYISSSHNWKNILSHNCTFQYDQFYCDFILFICVVHGTIQAESKNNINFGHVRSAGRAATSARCINLVPVNLKRKNRWWWAWHTCWRLPRPHLTAITSQLKPPLHHTTTLLPQYHQRRKHHQSSADFEHTLAHWRQLTSLSAPHSGPPPAESLLFLLRWRVMFSFLSLNNAWNLFEIQLYIWHRHSAYLAFTFRCQRCPAHYRSLSNLKPALSLFLIQRHTQFTATLLQLTFVLTLAFITYFVQ